MASSPILHGGLFTKWMGFCLICLLMIIWHRKIIRNPFLLIMALAFFIIASITSLQIKIPHKDFGLYEGHVKIVSNPELESDQIKFIGETSFSKVSFISKEIGKPVYHGATCRITGHLTVPEPATNSGQFDYQDYLAKQGISYVGYNVQILECEDRSWLSYLFRFRDVLKEQLNLHLSEETQSWVVALLFGDRNQLSDEVIDTFQYWGLSHLLAISGLHVGIILSICYLILNKLLHVTREQSNILLLLMIPIYIVLAGSQPPVMRAGMMAILIILFSLSKKIKMDSSDLISIVLIVLLIMDPYLMYQLSFQFSFAVTFALILSKRLLKNQSWIMLSLRISLISQLVILPLQFYYFYYTNVWSFLINLIYIPYFTLLVIPAVMVIFITVLLIPNITPFWISFS
ncbi:ComEC/Rec2 family competence protein [Piscibacillus salipiscarius]|uniref:ComEC/Rec2 family competence protein n=1 Tax=Piscibacillus salipiscarius TaxID=299480 RepID=UPI0006CFC13D|nr:ComEC/Rec2 family competence protein [Piscibacillus salipiscarius]